MINKVMTKVSPAYLCVTQLLKICGTFYLIPFNNEWCIMGNWFQNLFILINYVHT